MSKIYLIFWQFSKNHKFKEGNILKKMIKLMILAGLIFVVALSGCLGNGDNSTAISSSNSTDNSTNNSTDNSTVNNTTASSGFLKKAVLSENNTVLTFTFASNPDTGYNWTVEADNASILNKVSENFSPSPEASDAPGVQTWVFKGQTSGIVYLNFIYSNASEEGTEIEDLLYVISVNEDKSLEIYYTGSFANTQFYKGVFWDDNGDFTIELEENPTAGYSWHISIAPADALNKTKDYTNATTPDLTTDNAFSIHTWVYEGLKAGTVKMTFDYRSSEENSTFETAVYDLRISEDSMIDIIGVSYNTMSSSE